MLTEVEFHTGVPDPVAFACRLLRKVQRHGHCTWVTADSGLLSQLDEALWSFEPMSFVPHLRLDSAELSGRRQPGAPSTMAAERVLLRDRTPIWLAERGEPAPGRDLLVNVGGGERPRVEGWQRVIEIVAADAEAAARGRDRWRSWREIGVRVVHHPAVALDG